MFVKKSKYLQAVALAEYWMGIARNLQNQSNLWREHATTLANQVLRLKKESEFTADEIKTLIRLCHPDKHNDSPAATKMTKKLLSMRK